MENWQFFDASYHYHICCRLRSLPAVYLYEHCQLCLLQAVFVASWVCRQLGLSAAALVLGRSCVHAGRGCCSPRAAVRAARGVAYHVLYVRSTRRTRERSGSPGYECQQPREQWVNTPWSGCYDMQPFSVGFINTSRRVGRVGSIDRMRSRNLSSPSFCFFYFWEKGG